MSNFKKEFKDNFNETFKMDEESKKSLYSLVDSEINKEINLPVQKPTPTFSLFWKGFCFGSVALFMLFSLISVSIIVMNPTRNQEAPATTYPESFVVYNEVVDDSSKALKFTTDGFTSTVTNGATYTPIYTIEVYGDTISESTSLKTLLTSLHLSSLWKYASLTETNTQNAHVTISFDLSSKEIVSKYIFDLFNLLQTGDANKIVFRVVQTLVEGA